MNYPNIYDSKTIGTSGALPYHDGLGTLRDTLSCVVTLATDGTYELDMTYPAQGYLAEYLTADNLLRVKLDRLSAEGTENLQFFRIAAVEKNISASGSIITVHAEHISYDLKWSWHAPVTSELTSLSACASMLESGFISDGFTFQTGFNSSISYPQVGFTSDAPFTKREAVLEIANIFGAYVFFHNRKIWFMQRGSGNTHWLEKGKNLINLTVSEDSSQGVNGVYMYFLTDKEYAGATLYQTDSGPQYAMPHYVTHNYAEESEDVLDLVFVEVIAEGWMEKNGYTSQTSATSCTAQLADDGAENFALNDSVKIEAPELNASGGKITLTVSKIVYDVLSRRYESIEAGTLSAGIADTVAGLVGTSRTGAVQSAAEEAFVPVDYITESGTSGVWEYRKYYSGALEISGKIPVSSLAISTTIGGMYRSGSAYTQTSYPYPVEFKSPPTFTASFTTDNNVGALVWINYTSEAQAKTYPYSVYLMRPTSATDCSGYVCIHAAGRWK